MNSEVFIYFILIVICWTFNPFIKKSVLKNNKINTDEYFVLNHFIVTLLFIGYFIYLYKNSRCSPKCLKLLNRYDYMYIFLGSLTSVLAARLLLSIIKKNDVSYMVAHIQPLVILCTFIIGYLFFTESLTINKIIGGCLVILGIIFLNKKNVK